MTYTDSLWKDAPEGASYWIGFNSVEFTSHPSFTWWMSKSPPPKFDHNKAEVHPRPTIYQPAAQLVDQYRKEHGAQIEADVATTFSALSSVLDLPRLLYDAAFHLALLEKYLAAERARIEGATE
jgi:hypothetical protein